MSRVISTVCRRVAPVVLVLCLIAVSAAGCADQRAIWFENQRPDHVTVSIDGDRLLILRPGVTEALPYATAAWAWPRRIDVAVFAGPPLWSVSMDADELARNKWLIVIRP
jgi:hypothetical protein